MQMGRPLTRYTPAELHVFSLFINSRFIGEFQSPLEGLKRDCISYYCYRCGEVYARRVTDCSRPIWRTISGVCLACTSLGPVYEFTPFRLREEVQQGFAPAAILAQEFLFSYALFFEPIIQGRNRVVTDPYLPDPERNPNLNFFE